MPLPNRQETNLKRRLNRWQIFFIAIGGTIGIGFFKGASTSLAIAGPTGALVAVVVVGLVATAVMECICEMIVLWPIPNAMVEYVKSFVDEDLGVAVGFMYWYTYCVTFSALVIAVADLAGYWGIDYIFKALIYVLVPILLMVINSCPVEYFGWIEFFGGIAKLLLVLGVIMLMFIVNGGVNPQDDKIGTRYVTDGIAYNEQVSSARYQAVFEAIPIATFAYIGVELLTTTAFEARDPGELRLPAANVGWFMTVLYALTTGSIVTNLSWKDQNLPRLFNQALTMITDPSDPSIAKFVASSPEMQAAPLIALYRVGYRVLPGFLNACFIYSAVSCANSALYVASRQLYGMTRTVSVDYNSGVLRRALAWMSSVHYKTKAPWPAIAVSSLVLLWLPFIKVHSDDEFIQNLQGALINVGSVSCILMWASQCVAFIMFYHWRRFHAAELDTLTPRWDKLSEKRNGGHFKDFQPFIAYLGAFCTLVIVFLLNSVSLWNGKERTLKAISAFLSPAIVFTIWITRKLLRRDGRFRFFLDLSDFTGFERRLQALDDLVYPGEAPQRQETSSSHLPIYPRHTAFVPDMSLIPDPDYFRSNPTPQPPTYNRTNLTLTVPGEDDGAIGVAMTSSDNAAVVPDASGERREHRDRRSSLSPVNDRGFAKPYAPNSGRGLAEIHEVDADDDASRRRLVEIAGGEKT